MSLTRVLQILSAQQVLTRETDAAEEALRTAVAKYSNNRTESINAIRQLQAQEPAAFALAASRLAVALPATKVSGIEYLTAAMIATNAVVDPLLDQRVGHDGALALARQIAEVEPLIDARMMRKMMEKASGGVTAVPSWTALRVLSLLEKISDCSRVTLYLMQLARHPSAEVRSKAALLLGRGNLNLSRVKDFLGSEDGPTRANAVESLWGLNTWRVRALFQEAARDPDPRVARNALVGLCKAGDRPTYYKLLELSRAKDASSRRDAAWAMGHVGEQEFAAPLDVLAKDEDDEVRAMAAKSREMLRRLPGSEDTVHVREATLEIQDLHSYPSRSLPEVEITPFVPV